MHTDLTPAVARALHEARHYARADGATEVRPQHLLHALLEEREGRAAVYAARAGLDWDAYRAPPVTRADEPPPLPLGDLVENVLRHARAAARDLLDEHTVSGELLLLALLQTDEPLRRLAEALGLRCDSLRAAVAAERAPPLQLGEPPCLPELTEHLDAARILDAAANRAREGLRVVEDYFRFALDDAFLCRELKQLRHELAAALAGLPAHLLLATRETQRDVGAHISTAAEQQRGSLTDVVAAGLKRLQEALRSLEEYGKLHGAEVGRAVEALRYRSYTLERAILLGAAARERLRNVSLCVLLSASACAGSLERTIKEAAEGGAGMIQLREKGLDDRALWERARRVRRWTREAGVLLVVNDRPDVARLVEADGVHLGQEDLPVREARRIVGPDALIGVSTHDLDQVRQAVLDGASYLGVGPTFPSETKPFAHYPGLDFVRQALAETTLPAFVIGGVTLATVGAAAAAGARRVAVCQAVARADDPRSAAHQLVQALAVRADAQ